MKPSSVVGVFVGITLAKLALAAVWGETADITNILKQARGFLAGGDLLDAQATSGAPSFFPLGNYLLAAACLQGSEWTALPFAFVVKVPAILADLAIALALRRVVRDDGKTALLYLCNPVTFLLAVYHGQFHTVATAGVVFALGAAQHGHGGRAGVWLGCAAGIRQHFTALIIPLVKAAKVRRTMMLLGFAATAFALTGPLLIQSAQPARLLKPELIFGAWGYGLILLQAPRVLGLLGWDALSSWPAWIHGVLQTYSHVPYAVWTISFWIWVWRHREAELWTAALLFILGLYVVSPGIGVQWLIWAVPLWLVVNRSGAMRYSLLAGAFLAGSYWQWSLNAKYAVESITANLGLLSGSDLMGVLGVGLVGFLTWLYCATTAWRLGRCSRACEVHGEAALFGLAGRLL